MPAFLSSVSGLFFPWRQRAVLLVLPAAEIMIVFVVTFWLCVRANGRRCRCGGYPVGLDEVACGCCTAGLCCARRGHARMQTYVGPCVVAGNHIPDSATGHRSASTPQRRDQACQAPLLMIARTVRVGVMGQPAEALRALALVTGEWPLRVVPARVGKAVPESVEETPAGLLFDPPSGRSSCYLIRSVQQRWMLVCVLRRMAASLLHGGLLVRA